MSNKIKTDTSKVTIHMVSSLDGFIAKKDGSVSWMHSKDNYEKVLEIVGEICANTIAANAESVDLEGPHIENNEVIYAKGTTEDYNALYKAGLIGMALPRKYDGLNFPMLPYVMAAEMVARADAGFANIWGLQDCAETIYEFGSEEQKEKLVQKYKKDKQEELPHNTKEI